MFLPEGVGPASHVFQRVMTDIFADFISERWCFVLIDTIGLGAHTIDEAESHFLRVLQRCRETGVTLKHEKSFYCQDMVTFFGYEIGYSWTRMAASRIEALLQIPMPTSKTEMKSFLGCANFFLPFVPNFNLIASPLHAMTTNSFDWSVNMAQYRECFEKLQQACAHSVRRFSPNFDPETETILQTDACRWGFGSHLLQRLPNDHPEFPNLLVCIAICSMKFNNKDKATNPKNEETFTDYPKAATENAKRALKWKEENGNKNDCGTLVGWMRANQLAKKEPISLTTVKRMAAFIRHQENKDVSYDQGCGGLMWDAWGGDEGINWAINKIDSLK
jgi:hypothetical protein